PLQILSDNFLVLIRAILRREGLGEVPVFANELMFSGERLEARFPWRDPACARCAHCKAVHVRAASRRPRIFVGDGLSDVCPSIPADLVFAKDSLAAELERRGVAFRRYRGLDEILDYLVAHHAVPLTAPAHGAR